MIVIFLLGVSSGIPLLAIGSTLQAWMTDQKVDLSLIGIFSLVGIPYTLKFLWAPAMDRFAPLTFLGRRRGWMLVMQIALCATFVALGLVSPAQAPVLVALLAFMVAFFSASQDIIIDAYRREILSEIELGLGTSMGVNGYRVGMLISGALALFLADHLPWRMVYFFIASALVIGMLTTLSAPEPTEKIIAPRSLSEAIIQPFLDYFRRQGAIETLAFVLLYKIGDQMAANLTTPFILSLGFTKTTLGAIAKTCAMAATISGAFLGGIFILNAGLKRALWYFGILQAMSILSYSYLAIVGQNLSVLTAAIAFEYFTGGLGAAALTTFMASLTNRKFTATQFALLSSLAGIPRVLIAAPMGIVAEHLGWPGYFMFCTLASVPGLVLLTRYSKWQRET